jgi:hypothetical protein
VSNWRPSGETVKLELSDDPPISRRRQTKEDKTLQILTSWATVLASLAAITVAIVQVTK